MPAQRDLADKIRDHVQLRKLVARRQVILVDHRKPQPAIVIDPRAEIGETILESTLPLGGGYGSVDIRLRKLPKKETRPLSPGISSVCGVNAGAAVNADCGVGACGFVPWAWVAVFRWVARGWLGTDGRGSGR